MNFDSRRSAMMLSGVLGTAGTLHFASPRFFDALIPRWLPGGARTWTYGSGLLELATAALIATPTTRRRGGLAAAALFIAVFPGNVTMAVNWSDRAALDQAIAYGRLPLQIPLVLWALRVARVDIRAAIHERIG
jgi:uncharacterized membrane protein